MSYLIFEFFYFDIPKDNKSLMSYSYFVPLQKTYKS